MRKTSGRYMLLALAVAAGSVWAHHSPSAEFEMGKNVVVTGTLTKVDWVNPHIVVLMDAKSADGSVENWKMESNPPAWFRRVGVNRADLAKGLGQMVTVEGNRAKNGSAYMYMRKITFADGSSLELVNGQAPEGSQ